LAPVAGAVTVMPARMSDWMNAVRANAADRPPPTLAARASPHPDRVADLDRPGRGLADLEVRGLALGDRRDAVDHLVGRRERPRVDGRRLACRRARRDRQVDEVLVDPDRGHQAVGEPVVHVEQAVVDHDVAVDLRDAGRLDLGGQVVEPGHRVALGQDGARELVGVAVVDRRQVLVGQRLAAGLLAQAQGQIPGAQRLGNAVHLTVAGRA
jgi:hypothetical protein